MLLWERLVPGQGAEMQPLAQEVFASISDGPLGLSFPRLEAA